LPNQKTALLPIRKKLQLLVVFIFLSAGIVITGLGLEDAGESIKRAQRDMILYVEGLAAQQEQVTIWTKYLLSSMAKFPAVQRLEADACNTFFCEIMNQHPFYSFIGATTPRGDLFASSPLVEPGINFSDRKYLRDTIKTLDFSIGEFIVGRVSHLPSIHYAFPVLDSDRNLVAILIAGFNLDEYASPMAGMKLPEGSEVTVMDHRGMRLFHSPSNVDTAPGKAIENDLYLKISGKSESGIIERAGEDGVLRVCAYKQLKLPGDSSPYLYIMAGMPKSHLINKAGLQVLIHLLIVGIVGIIATYLSWVFGNRMIAMPIRQLLTAARHIGQGRMGARTDLPHTPDALGQLAKTFDNMASLLEKRDIEQKQADEALSQACSEMEKKVQERTADLTLSNAHLSEEILERKRLEEVLRESERKFKTLFQLSPEVILLASLEDAQVHEVNEAFCRFFGYRREETVGKATVDLDIWADRNELGAMIDLLASQGRVNDFECHLRTKSGEAKTALMSVGTLEMDGRAFMLSVARDITERKRAEDERARLVTAIEQVTEGIMIADTNCIIQYANPAYERLTGYGRSELIGRPAGILKSDVHDRSFCKEIEETLTKGDVWSGRIPALRKDGTPYEVEVLTSPVRDSSGAIINFISIRRDVTLEARLERELRQAQKMESIGTLAGGIAHDFNNILAAISGFAELAMKKVKGNEAAQRHLEQVLKASSRAADLVRQILAFSRQTEQERKPVQMTPIVKEVLKLLRSSLPSTIEIKQDIEIGPDGGMVLADLTQLHQVLLNLCTNAAHAMRAKGGTLSLKLSAVANAPKVSGYRQRKADHYVCLTVTDTGHGMNTAVMDRIFDPYFTTKGPGEGTGLGLSVVQGIVKSHGGVMTVSSEPGQGATFSVFLPGLEKMVPEEPKASESLSTGSERILFVDDEATLVDMGKVMLETLGYDVTAKTSSLDALQAFRDRPDAFDLVFTDMTMPSLTGRELAREITAIRKDVPIILCTGFSDMLNNREAREAGIRDLVIKPYIMNTLAKTIRNALDCPNDCNDATAIHD